MCIIKNCNEYFSDYMRSYITLVLNGAGFEELILPPLPPKTNPFYIFAI